MRNLLVILTLIAPLILSAEIPLSPDEVIVLRKSDQLEFKNFPQVTKGFKSARDKEGAKLIEQECQQWAFGTSFLARIYLCISLLLQTHQLILGMGVNWYVWRAKI